MVFKSSGRQQREAAMLLGDCVLEGKTSSKYLGLEVEQDWKWQQTKTRMLEKARKRMATVCALGLRRQRISVKAASSFVGGVGVAVEFGVRVNGKRPTSCSSIWAEEFSE